MVPWIQVWKRRNVQSVEFPEIRRYAGFVPAAYWAGTSENSIIDDLVKKADNETYKDLQTLGSSGSVAKPINPAAVYGDFDYDGDAVYSIMVMFGYLNAVPNRYDFDLSIPNKEMYGIFASMVSRRAGDKVPGRLSIFINALLNHDTDVMENCLYALLSNTVGFRVLDNEHSYQAFTAGLLLYLEGKYKVTADYESGNGLHDIRMECMKGNSPNVIIEIKRTSSSSKSAEKLTEEASSQIKEKYYDHGLKGDTILYGISFDGKKPFILSECVMF